MGRILTTFIPDHQFH